LRHSVYSIIFYSFWNFKSRLWW